MANETVETLAKKITDLEDRLANTRIYRGWYRAGGVGPCEKIFNCVGTVKDAIDTFYKHCKAMGYIFIIVKPYSVDLKHQEKLKLEDPEFVDETLGVRARVL